MKEFLVNKSGLLLIPVLLFVLPTYAVFAAPRLRAWRIKRLAAALNGHAAYGSSVIALNDRSGRFDVEIYTGIDGSLDSPATVFLFNPALPRKLSVIPRNKVDGGLGFKTGDTYFDKKYVVLGNKILAAVVLSINVRERFLVSLSHHEPTMRLEKGCSKFTYTAIPGISKLRKSFKEFAKTSEKFLIKDEEIPCRIFLNFHSEQNPATALWFLKTLAENFPAHTHTDKALMEAASHENLTVRYFAALQNPSVPLDTLLEAMGHPDVRPEIRRTAVERMEKLPHTPELLFALVAFLSDSNPEPLRLSALAALAEKGTRECVEKILPYTEGLLADGDVKKAAREAVEKIQSRLGDVGTGRISLAAPAPAEGAISVANEAGRITEAG